MEAFHYSLRKSCLFQMHITLALLLFPFLFSHSQGCWGTTAPNFGDTSQDYDLLIGSELILNCTLNIKTFPGFPVAVDSSNLAFKKDNKNYSAYTHIVNSNTAQLRISNAQVEDSGIYHCSLILPNSSSKPHVCSTHVSVGYPPQKVSNFTCISRNFDNLTCTWDIEPNRIKTNYSLQKNLFSISAFQNCPLFNDTFCQWSDNSDPPYQTSNRNLVFLLHGNNSLGSVKQEYTFDHFEIVIPNVPENVVAEVGKNLIVVHWSSPNMKNILDKPPLYYEVSIEELGSGTKNRSVYEIGVEKYKYVFHSLLPHFIYNVSVRCKSNFTSGEDMWSKATSLVLETLSDVPSVLPEINPQAFELYNFETHRNATLYWKPVPQRFYNGLNFHYHLIYFESHSSEENGIIVKSHTPHVKIGGLRNDRSYVFHLHTANTKGVSPNFQTFVIAERKRIAPAPVDIRAISNELGHYNLTWSVPFPTSDKSFTVFWCSSVRPIISRCDGPIQWTDTPIKTTNALMKFNDVGINFQFAVAAIYHNQSSGLQWASCIVPSKAPLGKIPITHIDKKSPTALKIFWKLDCDAQKSVIQKYEIQYCKISKPNICDIAKPHTNTESYLLENLQPFTNYSIKLRAFNKENKSSEDIEGMYLTTLPGAPADPPQNVSVIFKNNSAFVLKWHPPSVPNGIVTHYIIHYNGLQKNVSVEDSVDSLEYEIHGLKEFTFYNVSVEACVTSYCSQPSSYVTLTTDIGKPGVMDPPRVESLNKTHLKVSWMAPSMLNGPISFYELQWQQDDRNYTSQHSIAYGLSVVVESECPTLFEGEVMYSFSIRAANVNNGTIYFGDFSEPTKAMPCLLSQAFKWILGATIGGTIALGIIIFVMFKLVKWMQKNIHGAKVLGVKLPGGLEKHETNSLKIYNALEHDHVQSSENNNSKPITCVATETDNKNRHGSGSSQFSNSSSDELLHKHGKCTKFGRKPSGDSSGCSSISSNNTTHMHQSSDSGTESDLTVPPSPDSGIVEQSFHNSFKKPMPILMEVQDPGSEPDAKVKPPEEMVLKIDQPYSKLGISPLTNFPTPTNSLAFYSLTLANSEPSLSKPYPIQKDVFLAPYSKVGLSKSGCELLNSNQGYSKLGFAEFQKCYTIEGNHAMLEEGQAHGSATSSQSHRVVPSKFREDTESSKHQESTPFVEGRTPGYVMCKDLQFHMNERNLNQNQPINTSSSCASNDSKKESPLYSVSGNSLYPFDSFETNISHAFTDDLWSEALGRTLDNADESYLSDFTSSSEGDLHSVLDLSSTNTSLEGDDQRSYPSECENFKRSDMQVPPLWTELEDDCISLKNAIVTDVAKKNGYVPFSELSSLSCVDVPNVMDHSSSSLSTFPGELCVGFEQNYITPSNKNDLKLLQKDEHAKNQLALLSYCNKKVVDGEKNNINDILPMDNSLNYILKTIPKVESEICEV